MFDKILQVVLRFFGKKTPELPTEDKDEALEKVEALDKIGESSCA